MAICINPHYINAYSSTFPLNASIPKDIFIKILCTLTEQTPYCDLNATFHSISLACRGSWEIIKNIKYACFNLGVPFSILSPNSFNGYQSVHRIKKYLLTHPALISINLSGIQAVGNSLLKNFKSDLTYLNLSYCTKITNMGLQELSRLEKLRSLDCSFCENITATGLSNMTSLTNLTNLNMSDCSGIAKRFHEVSCLTALTSLNFRNCDLPNHEIFYLARLTGLKSLDLSRCWQINRIGLAHLTGLINLTQVNLSLDQEIDDEGIAHLRKLTNLASLSLKLCYKITDRGIAHLNALVNMTFLDLTHCHNVTDVSITHLISLIGLHTFKLGYTSITPTGMETLTQFNQLRTLNLDCMVMNDTLSHLTGLSNLTELSLSGKNITNDCMKHLTKLQNLTSLHLTNCSVTDIVCERLTHFTHLTAMDFSECDKITPGCLHHLTLLTHLTYLNVRYCDRFENNTMLLPSNLKVDLLS